ncbi:MAG: hypothetical protein WKF56_05015 [Candidatus Limnocylindrales bacterium]
MDGRQGVELLRLSDPAVAIPVHFDDYDVFESPLADFVAGVDRAGLSSRVRCLQRGDTYDL